MPIQNARLVAELTKQEEAEIVALEASIRHIHLLVTIDTDNARRAAKSIKSIRSEAQRGLELLGGVDVGNLNARDQRDYMVQVETFTRTIAAADKVEPLRLM